MSSAPINALKAAGRVVAAAVQKKPLFVSESEKNARLAECHRREGYCFDAHMGTCRVCHCFIGFKSKLLTEDCPGGFWPKLTT